MAEDKKNQIQADQDAEEIKTTEEPSPEVTDESDEEEDDEPTEQVKGNETTPELAGDR